MERGGGEAEKDTRRRYKRLRGQEKGNKNGKKEEREYMGSCKKRLRNSRRMTQVGKRRWRRGKGRKYKGRSAKEQKNKDKDGERSGELGDGGRLGGV